MNNPAGTSPELNAAASAVAPTGLVSVITAEVPDRLTKRWAVVDGQPQKEGAGQLVAGEVNVFNARNPDEFVQVLNGLRANQALVYGIPGHWPARIVTGAKLGASAGNAIARNNQCFSWSTGPGWLLLDYDPVPGEQALSREDLIAQLVAVCPGLAHAPMVWGVSSSSSIWRTNTDEPVTGICGQRLYVLIASAADIPRAGEVLVQRLWLAGAGRFVVSKSGRLLRRTMADASVWQPCRLDFAAPPICEAPLECRRPAWEAMNSQSAPMDTRLSLPNLSAQERQRLATIENTAKNDDALRAEQKEKRQTWMDDRLAAYAGKPEQVEDYERVVRFALDRQTLMPDFEVTHSSGESIIVGALLEHPDKWHGERFFDPLEPEYSNSDNRIAWANLNNGGFPYLHSHAHGGIRYKLIRQSQVLLLSQGELPNVVAEVLARMRTDAQIFERGGRLVRVADDELVPVEPAWLQTYIESAFKVQVYDGRATKMVLKDCPEKLAMRVLAARGSWDLPKLKGLTTFPFVRSDGSVHDIPGFDPVSGLLFINDIESRPAPKTLEDAELTATLQRIWEPFAQFPFTDDLSRGVFLAALLTTVCRPALPTAPAFLIRAHTAGTGKTLLSECLMILVGGRLSSLPLPEGNSEEIEKRLFATIITGQPGLILDNLVGIIDNAALSAFLTSPEPSGRILGKTQVLSATNRALWVFNGNNVTAGGDTFRRILPITLDANTESPESRKFDFNPKQLVANRLPEYRADLINVLYTFVQKRSGTSAAGSFASFEEWEKLVRQCVCWLINKSVVPVGMVDPAGVLGLSKEEDPSRHLHGKILEAWHRVYGETVVHMRKIVELVNGPFAPDADFTALAELLKDLIPPKQSFDGRFFGGWLRKHKGVVINGYRVDPGDPQVKEAGWRVTQIHKTDKQPPVNFY